MKNDRKHLIACNSLPKLLLSVILLTLLPHYNSVGVILLPCCLYAFIVDRRQCLGLSFCRRSWQIFYGQQAHIGHDALCGIHYAANCRRFVCISSGNAKRLAFDSLMSVPGYASCHSVYCSLYVNSFNRRFNTSARLLFAPLSRSISSCSSLGSQRGGHICIWGGGTNFV